MAVAQLATLDESHFFLAYPNFVETWIHFNKKYAHKLDKDDEHIKFAAEKYFLDLFENNRSCPNVDVAFEEKQVRGIQVSLMKCVFGFNLNLIIKTFIGWLDLCGNEKKRRPNRSS